LLSKTGATVELWVSGSLVYVTETGTAPVANATIELYMDSTKLGEVVTGDNGEFTFKFSVSQSGLFQMTVKFPGTADYLPSEYSWKLHVIGPGTYSTDVRFTTSHSEVVAGFIFRISGSIYVFHEGEWIAPPISCYNLIRVWSDCPIETFSATWNGPAFEYTLHVGSDAGAGSYTLKAIFTGTTIDEITFLSSEASTTITVSGTLPNFSISISQTTLKIKQGESAQITVTIKSLNGFAETVTLLALPVNDLQATFNPGKVTPPADGSITSTLTIQARRTATPRTYSLVVGGVTGEVTYPPFAPGEIYHQTWLTVEVEAVPVETANLTGKVTESILFGLIKRPSTGAIVSLNAIKTVTANGTYTLTNIPLGTYTVTVAKPFFETKTAQISLTEPGKTYTLDFEIPLSRWINMMAITAPIITVGTTIIKLKKKK
jgi:hypothetical protein